MFLTASFYSLNFLKLKKSLESLKWSFEASGAIKHFVYPCIREVMNSRKASLISYSLNSTVLSSGSTNTVLNAWSTYSSIGSGLSIHSVAFISFCFKILSSLLGGLGLESLKEMEPLSKSTLYTSKGMST